MAEKILIVDDDIKNIEMVIEACNAEIPFEVEYALDGVTGCRMALSTAYRLIVLDLSLPGMSGNEICKQIRAVNNHVPIVMLTSRSSELDKVLGLELGADDYVAKPFSARELVARVKALLRRSEWRFSPAEEGNAKILVFGPLTIDCGKRSITLHDEELTITSLEFDLILYLATRQGKVVSREDLVENVLGYEPGMYDNSLSTHLSRIRAKLQPTKDSPTFIVTVRGLGTASSNRSVGLSTSLRA